MANVYLVMFVLLVLAYIVSLVCKKLRIPRVVGQIAVGILIAAIPFVYNGLIDPATLDMLAGYANIGIVMLFFFVGLEIDIKDVKKDLKVSEAISLLNTLIPLTVGYLTSHYLLGIDEVASLIIGVALSVSAQSIAIDFLEEAGKLKTRIGKLIVVAGTVDDINEFVLLTILFLFIGTATGVTLDSLLTGIVLFAVVMAITKVALEKSTVIYRKHHAETTLFMGALIVIFLFGYLTDFIGVGATIGAMLAGMLVRRSLLSGKTRNIWEEHEIVRTVNTVAFGLFVPLFFIWVGLNTDLNLIVNNLIPLFLFGIIAFVGTIGGTMLGARVGGYSWRDGYITGWALNAKGDVELAVLSLALQKGLISQDLFSIVIVIALLTTIISPIMFTRLSKNVK